MRLNATTAKRPHMKLRGLSRRSRQRRVSKTVYPYVQLHLTGRNVEVRIGIDGGYRLEVKNTYDGLGRRIGLTETTITKTAHEVTLDSGWFAADNP